MRSRINKYSETSGLMNINIAYGKEVFKFNLSQELVIDEATIQDDLKTSAQKYAFLKMLHTRLLIKARDLDKNRKKVRAIRLERLIEDIGAVKRAEVALEKDKKYRVAYKDWLTVEGQKEIIEVCVKSFEQRTELLRTLSANLRQEQFNS